MSAAEYHKEKLDDFRIKMKEKLKHQFRNSFVQKGRLTFNRENADVEPDQANEELVPELEADQNENKTEQKPPHSAEPSNKIDCLEDIEDKFDQKDKFDADPMYDEEI